MVSRSRAERAPKPTSNATPIMINAICASISNVTSMAVLAAALAMPTPNGDNRRAPPTSPANLRHWEKVVCGLPNPAQKHKQVEARACVGFHECLPRKGIEQNL